MGPAMVRPTATCPWCEEEVRPGATVCRHCGNDPRWTAEQIAAWEKQQWAAHEMREQHYETERKAWIKLSPRVILIALVAVIVGSTIYYLSVLGNRPFEPGQYLVFLVVGLANLGIFLLELYLPDNK